MGTVRKKKTPTPQEEEVSVIDNCEHMEEMPFEKKKIRAKGTQYKDWVSEENLLLVEGWCRDGASDKTICEFLQISYTTLYKWIRRYPEFASAMERGKEVVDRKVENALLKRCLGFEYIEVEEVRKGGEIVSAKKTKKYTPPDVTACAIWLNNRKPDEWKRNRDNYTISENEGGIQINIVKKDIPEEGVVIEEGKPSAKKQRNKTNK